MGLTRAVGLVPPDLGTLPQLPQLPGLHARAGSVLNAGGVTWDSVGARRHACSASSAFAACACAAFSSSRSCVAPTRPVSTWQGRFEYGT
jgi:hypothetical protein